VHSLVRAHARGQRVLDAVTFFDDLPLAEFFTGIDLVAVPRTRDGVPYSLVEALVNGMPVVGSNSGGIADTLAPFSGWLVPDEAQSFAEGFRAAWADIDAAWNAAQAQRPATRAAFSPEKSAAHQLDTYARLVAVEAVSSASGGS
jgi:glycosyltransferase involved in cell wall biosynthesis